MAQRVADQRTGPFSVAEAWNSLNTAQHTAQAVVTCAHSSTTSDASNRNTTLKTYVQKPDVHGETQIASLLVASQRAAAGNHKIASAQGAARAAHLLFLYTVRSICTKVMTAHAPMIVFAKPAAGASFAFVASQARRQSSP